MLRAACATARTIRAYLERGIFYVMIQTNVPDAPAKLKALISNRSRESASESREAGSCFSAVGSHLRPGGTLCRLRQLDLLLSQRKRAMLPVGIPKE